jgi:hypothetical protein
MGNRCSGESIEQIYDGVESLERDIARDEARNES